MRTWNPRVCLRDWLNRFRTRNRPQPSAAERDLRIGVALLTGLSPESRDFEVACDTFRFALPPRFAIGELSERVAAVEFEIARMRSERAAELDALRDVIASEGATRAESLRRLVP